jgi:hypothetical protein
MKKREYLVLHFDGSPTDKQRHTIEEGDIGFVACTFRRLYRKPNTIVAITGRSTEQPG